MLQKEVHQLNVLDAEGNLVQETLAPGVTVKDIMEESFARSYDPDLEGAMHQREVSVAFYMKMNDEGVMELHAGMQLGKWGEHWVDNQFFDALMPNSNTELARDLGLNKMDVMFVAESHSHPDFEQGVFSGVPSPDDVSLARAFDTWNRHVPDVKSYLISNEGIFSYENR